MGLMCRTPSSGWRSRLDRAIHPRFMVRPQRLTRVHPLLVKEGHPPVHASTIPSMPLNAPTTEPLTNRLTAVVYDAQEESC
jgi:hypothetical protein